MQSGGAGTEQLVLTSTENLNHELWPEARRLYHQAFPQEGRKSDAVIKRMFERRIGMLHMGQLGQQVAAMAITGISDDGRVLLIDYLTVREDLRGQGIGVAFVDAVSRWAMEEQGLEGMLIEVEADGSPVNAERVRFWGNCGFTPTEYVHSYRWVPEPYRAMYRWFKQGSDLPVDGEILFRYITGFHHKAYAK
ncbi:GNAT family N-acetyltransferase [Paenibacillus nasutitermitis]|uniref:N-acetyltransferase domain-containing protein n=1 Tax=Paenibacillus nasutitermitis TaxID=1652958 RepID=A0A917DU39_9BACL|nr:GNAT family N-acetyltransferase [Paenibacillus nasutitermitis]GGD66858.1 hypothetical protein GCM10010911_25780 [Paenibacillus nasutitermitis]